MFIYSATSSKLGKKYCFLKVNNPWIVYSLEIHHLIFCLSRLVGEKVSLKSIYNNISTLTKIPGHKFSVRYKIGQIGYYLLVLVLASTLVGLNWLPPEQVQHLEPSQPTFADPEPGHTKWQANCDSITEDQLLGDLIVLLGHPWLCWPTSSAAHRHVFAS